MARICIDPLGIHLQILDDETLLHGLQRAKVSLEAICGGKGYCGTCLVQILKGQTQLGPITAQEQTTLNNLKKSSLDYRLSCQTHVQNSEEVVCRLHPEALAKVQQIFDRLKNRYAPRDIHHPRTGELLVAKGGVVTHEILERLLSA